MDVVILSSPEAVCVRAARLMADKPHAVLGLPTGATPGGCPGPGRDLREYHLQMTIGPPGGGSCRATRWLGWLVVVVGCSGNPGGPPADGSTGTQDTNSSGDMSSSGGTGGTMDGLGCGDACAKVLALCPDYGSVWVDACTTACNNKQIVKPELAQTETDCIRAAQDCTTATICASDLPSGGNVQIGESHSIIAWPTR